VSAAVGASKRPAGLVVFCLLALFAFAGFIGLGTWQIERKAWKETLIATLDARLALPPVALPPRERWPSLNPGSDEFRRVSLRAEFLRADEGRVYTGGSGLRSDIKSPGYFAFAPARLSDGIIVVNRGYVANAHPDAALRPIALPEGAVDVVGVLRFPELPGWFVTEHSASEDLWFARDHLVMAAHYGWGVVAPFYIDQEAPLPAGGVPRPSPLQINLRNEHLQYALTWFGLAGVLAVAFGFWLKERPGSPRRVT